MLFIKLFHKWRLNFICNIDIWPHSFIITMPGTFHYYTRWYTLRNSYTHKYTSTTMSPDKFILLNRINSFIPFVMGCLNRLIYSC